MKAHAVVPALVFLVFGTCVLGMAALAKRSRAAILPPASSVSARAP